MKILLLGKNAQAGWELQRGLAPFGSVTALGFDTPGPWQADFSKPERLPELVRAPAPDPIVKSATHTMVDEAEGEPALERTINATAPGVLAREAAAIGAWPVLLSVTSEQPPAYPAARISVLDASALRRACFGRCAPASSASFSA